jgi:TP901 family phage tail tape measure protein
MAIAEQLVIKARLDLSGVASDVEKLRSQLESASKVSTASLDIEAKKAALIDAQIAKELAGVEKINAAKEQAAQREQARQDAQIGKQEQAAQREIARQEAAAVKQQQVAANLISSLERQKATLGVRSAEGGGDREAALIAQELLRYKQQIADIDAKLIDPADIVNARGLADEINRLNLEKIDSDFRKAGAVTFGEFLGGATERARDLAEQLQFTSQVLGNIGSTFTQFGDQAKAAFAEFDEAKTKVATLSNQSDGFANTAVKLAASLNNQVSSAEILTAQYEILSSGFTNVKDASEIARVSILGAKAGFTDTATVADATTSVLNAYGKSASDAALLVDQFAVVQDKGKTTIGQFAGQLGNIAPIAKAAGVSFEEVAAAIATTTASGVQTSSAVAGTRQAIISLLRPTGEAAKELEKYGIANSAAALKAGGLSGVLGTLASKGVTSSEQLSKIFTDVEGLAAVLPLVSGNLGKFNENLAAVQNASGKAQSGFDIVAESAQGRITEALNKANEALVNVGRGATVAFAPFIDIAGDAIGIFNQLPAPVQTAAGAVIGISGALFTGAAALTAAGAAAPAFVGGLKLLGFEAGRATIASVALTTATNINAGANAFLSKQITLTAIAQSASTAKTIVATAVTNAWTAAVALGGTQVTLLGVKTAASALIAKASFASFATGIAGLLSPLGLVAAAVGALVIGAKPLADAFNVSNSTKSIDELKNKLKELRAERGKPDPVEQTKDDRLGAKDGTFVNPFDTRLSEQKEVIKFSEAQKEYNLILDQSKNLLAEYGLTGAEAGDRVRLGAKGIEEFTKKADEQKQEIDATIESLKAQAGQAGDNPALRKQLNNEIAIFSNRKKLLDDRVKFLKESTDKETQVLEEATKEQRKKAARILEERNQDKELGIKRSQEDVKSKRDLENANAIKAIEERNAIAKGELDKKQALETEELKEKQALTLQEKQRAFDDTQAAKKLQREEEIDAKKRANELSLQALQQAFDDRQAKQKEERAEKIRQDDEKFANARAERDRKNSEALSGAKSLIASEGEIAKAKPEERAKVAQKVQEEQRISIEAKSQGVAGEQTQEQLVAKAKEIARVQAIVTAEEQAKVQLALDALESANKAKQAELDKAEDAKRTEAKRVADKEFEAQQQAAKRDFETQQNNEKLAFEQTILKPEKLKLEKELQADKLAFEQGELAAIKKQQAADERSLRTQQEAEDLALKKAADAELDGIKQAQKQRDIEIDRKFEDEKIARERAFKEEQRNLDKASAAEIQAILGQTSKQLFDAVAAISNSKISAIAGIGAKNNIVPTTGDKGDPLTQIKAGADAIGASTLVTPTATPQASAAKSALQEALRNKIPAFANGGVSKGGLALVGERGREIVNLPKGASVTPANDTRSLLSKGSDNSRVEALLEKLIGSVNRPNLEIKTTDDPVTIATDIYRRTAAQDLKRSGL